MIEELPSSGGAQHPPPASPQRSGMGLQRDVPHSATGRVTRQLLLLLEHPKGRDLCLQQPSTSRLCHANAEMGHRGSQRRLEAPRKNIHVPRLAGL